MPCAARAWLGSKGRPLTANSITQPTKSWLSTCPLLWRIGSRDLIPPTVTLFGWTSRVLREHERVKISKNNTRHHSQWLCFPRMSVKVSTQPQSRYSHGCLVFYNKDSEAITFYLKLSKLDAHGKVVSKNKHSRKDQINAQKPRLFLLQVLGFFKTTASCASCE